MNWYYNIGTNYPDLTFENDGTINLNEFIFDKLEETYQYSCLLLFKSMYSNKVIIERSDILKIDGNY